ncbi:hypothetical protein [Bacillus velezensis]|uniref:hypothetical protein n=1 Tax=Bacillus velezensis TaxID=492670 RepID=UPI00224038E2|nr:hypothetical protein [Bacillus velezensis]
MKVRITLKSGVIAELTPTEENKSLIGLWIWALNKKQDQILSFVEGHVLTSEIAMLQEVK